MDTIAERLVAIKNKLNRYDADLVVVSKFRPLAEIQEVINEGFLDLGENRVQEMVFKHEELKNTALRWHQIGTLQRNKVKYIVPFVHLIHAIDKRELLLEVDLQARKIGRKVPVLLQVFIAQEETKFGFNVPELEKLVQDPIWGDLEYVELKGLMGMATNTDNKRQIEAEFKGLRARFDDLKATGKPLEILSMGMTHDWEIALEHGSTLVRLGSAVFGQS